MTGVERSVRLRPGVRLLTSGSGVGHLSGPPGRFTLPSGGVGVARDLARRGWRVADLAAAHPTVAAPQELVDALDGEGWLEIDVAEGGRALYSMSAVRPAARRGVAATPGVLSPFAVLTRVGDGLVVASPFGVRSVRLHDASLAGVLPGLARSGAGTPDPPAELVDRFVADLADCGLLASDAEARSALRPHELWFHMADHVEHGWVPGDPPPARRDHPGTRTPLPVPDRAEVSHRDPSLLDVMEQRESVRRHDHGDPITLAGLAELLHRTFRVRGRRVVGGAELRDRPIPAGGSLHELEVYPVVGLVDGLEPGLYHYDSDDHALVALAPVGPGVRRLFARAAAAAAMASEPQVVLVLTARVDRLAWKYRGMAYSLALKHVGVAQQSLYLVSTAMGLAPCALGDGDRAAFAEASGIDPFAEPVVGEFVVGSRPEGVPGAGER